MTVTIYTDGACSPNPGRGGWAAIFVAEGIEMLRLFGSRCYADSHEMELLAILEVLRFIKRPGEFTIVCDSETVIGQIKLALSAPLSINTKYRHLLREIASLAASHAITWELVPSHAGDRFNERADEMAYGQTAPGLERV